MCLSRQSLPQLAGSNSGLVSNGGYVLYENKNNLEKLLISGSNDSASESIFDENSQVLWMDRQAHLSTLISQSTLRLSLTEANATVLQ